MLPFWRRFQETSSYARMWYFALPSARYEALFLMVAPIKTSGGHPRRAILNNKSQDDEKKNMHKKCTLHYAGITCIEPWFLCVSLPEFTLCHTRTSPILCRSLFPPDTIKCIFTISNWFANSGEYRKTKRASIIFSTFAFFRIILAIFIPSSIYT